MACCNKRHLFAIISTIVILLSVVYWGGIFGLFPIIKITSESAFANKREDLSSDCIVTDSITKPFVDIEFNKMVLLFDFNDYDECCKFPEYIPHRKVLWTSDIDGINSLKNSTWHASGGDICTISSRLLLLNNNHIVKSYEILFEQNKVGIQSQETGWIYSVENKEILSLFSRFSICHNLLLRFDG